MRKPVPALDPDSIPGLGPRPERRPGPMPPPLPRPTRPAQPPRAQPPRAAVPRAAVPRPSAPPAAALTLPPQAAGPAAPGLDPAPGPSPDELRYLILAVQREGSRRHATRLRAAGLTPAQAEVLEVLEARAPLTLAELGRLLICETGSPSRLVDTLVQRGLVTRTPGDRDRRVVSLGLSPAGHEALASSGPAGSGSAAATARDTITARLSGPELGQLNALLRKLISGTPGAGAIAERFPAAGG